MLVTPAKHAKLNRMSFSPAKHASHVSFTVKHAKLHHICFTVKHAKLNHMLVSLSNIHSCITLVSPNIQSWITCQFHHPNMHSSITLVSLLNVHSCITLVSLSNIHNCMMLVSLLNVHSCITLVSPVKHAQLRHISFTSQTCKVESHVNFTNQTCTAASHVSYASQTCKAFTELVLFVRLALLIVNLFNIYSNRHYKKSSFPILSPNVYTTVGIK